MTELPLIAQGRDADVYAIDDTRVLRRYRNPEHSNTLMEPKAPGCARSSRGPSA